MDYPYTYQDWIYRIPYRLSSNVIIEADKTEYEKFKDLIEEALKGTTPYDHGYVRIDWSK